MLSCSATELGLDVLEALFMKVHLLLDLLAGRILVGFTTALTLWYCAILFECRKRQLSKQKHTRAPGLLLAQAFAQ